MTTTHLSTQSGRPRRITTRGSLVGTALVTTLAGLATFGYSAAATIPDGELLPEGIYRTGEVTRDQLIATGVAAGFDPTDVEAFVAGEGIDGSAVIGLRLVNGGWSTLLSDDGDPEVVGWRATYGVIDDETIIATEPCGSTTFHYRLDGDQLTLDVDTDQVIRDWADNPAECPAAVEGLIAQTILSETAPFVRVPETAPNPAAADEPATYSSTSFVVPFDVTLPEWVAPEPAIAESNFVTWESATAADRGIRFLAPLNLYPPGSTTTTALPGDYVSYLLSQAEHGARFSDIVETTVDGLPATIVTATVEQSLDGGLGCQADGLEAADCYGLQPNLSLRLAVIEVGDQPLLIWVRDIRGVNAEYDTFDAMLASLRFRESTDDSDQPAASVETTAAEQPATTGSPPTNSNLPSDTIPNGTYTRVATHANGDALGLDPQLVNEILGADGELPVSIEIEDDRWTLYVTNDAGVSEQGDLGASTYDNRGRWVTVSESSGCRGCVIAFDWTYAEGTLSLTLSPVEGREYPDGERFVTEGIYERQQ